MNQQRLCRSNNKAPMIHTSIAFKVSTGSACMYFLSSDATIINMQVMYKSDSLLSKIYLSLNRRYPISSREPSTMVFSLSSTCNPCTRGYKSRVKSISTCFHMERTDSMNISNCFIVVSVHNINGKLPDFFFGGGAR